MPDSHITPRAEDFMTRDVQTVPPDMPLAKIIEFLEKHDVSNVPVVQRQNGRNILVGFISERDCLEFLANESFYGSPAPPQTAATIMRKHPICVRPESELYTLASIFVNHEHRHLPVVDNGELLGIVSRRDVLRAMNKYYWSEVHDKERKREHPDFEELMQRRFVVSER